MPPHRFGPFTLSAGERVVWRSGKPVALAPKAIDILLVLLEQRERFVGKRELIETVWPAGFVDEGNLTQTMYVLRCFFRDQKTGISIENVPKRGYRLVVPDCAAEETKSEDPEPDDDDEPRGPRPQWRLTRPTWGGAIVLAACAAYGASMLQQGAPALHRQASFLDVATTSRYLLAKEYQERGDRHDMERSANLYANVARDAPQSALGFAGMAETEASLAFSASTAPAAATLRASALVAARHAVALDSSSAAAFAALGGVQMSVQHDDRAAGVSFERALRLDPDEANALVWEGTLLVNAGKVEAARRLFGRAVALAPESPGTVASLAWSDFLAGDYGDAIAFSKQMLAGRKLESVARLTLANAYVQTRDFAAAGALLGPLARDASTRLQARALAARIDALQGRRALALAAVRKLDALDPDAFGDWDVASLAAAHLALDDSRQAMVWLARVRLSERRQIACDPRFEALRNDRRFALWVAG